MIVGVPREIKDGEQRVALAAPGVDALVRAGHRVLVESEAGLGSGIGDDEYRAHGAQIVDAATAWDEADMVVKVKEPLEPEYEHLRPGLTLFTYLHLASSRALTEVLLRSGVTAVAYETVQTDDGHLPLLEPMSEVAGKLATQVGARCLESTWQGRGVLLGGVTGVAPAEVIIIGAGTVGQNAAHVALGLGAQVTLLDIDARKLRHMEEITHGNLVTLFSNPYAIARAASYADLLICAVLIPGARAPRLVTAEMVRSMKPGSAIVDVAIDQGGCVETIRQTSHSRPTYVLHDVVHYAVPNIPALVPRTSTFALTSVTLPYVLRIADLGVEAACAQDSALRRGLNIMGGKVVHEAIAHAFPDLPASTQDPHESATES
ncbi:MAG: alanine dehydrogenase [Armatimonadota bacterium]